jgi:O-methyltransferase
MEPLSTAIRPKRGNCRPVKENPIRKMKLTKIQKWLKTKGIAVRRFNVLTSEEKRKISSPNDYDVYQSECYYAPWKVDREFLKTYHEVAKNSLLAAPRCWVLYSAVKQALTLNGELWECGVYRGGTAHLLKLLRDEYAASKTIRLFDSFIGMPKTSDFTDVHKEGDFSDTSLETVRSLVGTGGVVYHPGFIPQTFEGLCVDKIAFAHVDLDLHDAILESCKYVYPRLSKGGVMVFDDYGFASCPGARIAVDDFFKDKPEFPLVLPTAQAIIHKL